MIRRVATVSDPTLAIGRAALAVAPAPMITSAPPVVLPRARVAVEEGEPELPFAEVPVVGEGVLAAAAVSTPVQAVATVLDAPPEHGAPAIAPWPAPVPTFTYLSGAAGSGKTFLTKQWAEDEPGLLLCATTGIAAINLGGETINSVLGYFDTTSLQESFIGGFLTAKLGRLWKSGIKRLILDEVSMLSGDQFGFLVKAIEECNNRQYVLASKKKDEDDDGPPPAMGLTLVGDFLQLPPVKAPFAFEAPEWDRITHNVVTLTEIRRQADADFIAMLRAARLGQGAKVAEYLLDKNMIAVETDDHFDGPTLMAKNESVDRYNALRMQQLPGPEVAFKSTRWGKQRSEWGNPDKPPSTWGIPETLQLKEGALVMVLANKRERAEVVTGMAIQDDDVVGVETSGRSRLIYVNGDLGELVGAGEETAYFKPGGVEVRARVAYVGLQRTGQIVSVFPVTRDVKLPCDSARRKELRAQGREDLIDGKWELVGQITYMPLRVAYASTVHKSQGLSLDAVQVNVRDAFFKTPGMLYVALSRARTAGGLRLVGSRAAIVERCATHPKLARWL